MAGGRSSTLLFEFIPELIYMGPLIIPHKPSQRMCHHTMEVTLH
jgi:hypothetical protein